MNKETSMDASTSERLVGLVNVPMASEDDKQTWNINSHLMERCIWSTGEVAEMLGINPRQIHHWVDKEILIPARTAWGKGSIRGFSSINLVQAAIIDNLWKSGVSLERIKSIMDSLDDISYFRNLKTGRDDDKPKALLVLDDDEVQIRNEVRLEEFENGHKRLTYVNLVRIEWCVREAVDARLVSA